MHHLFGHQLLTNTSRNTNICSALCNGILLNIYKMSIQCLYMLKMIVNATYQIHLHFNLIHFLRFDIDFHSDVLHKLIFHILKKQQGKKTMQSSKRHRAWIRESNTIFREMGLNLQPRRWGLFLESSVLRWPKYQSASRPNSFFEKSVSMSWATQTKFRINWYISDISQNPGKWKPKLSAGRNRVCYCSLGEKKRSFKCSV